MTDLYVMTTRARKQGRLPLSEVKIEEVILTDLDCTVFDTRARAGFAPSEEERKIEGAWIPYSKACHTDVPIHGVVSLLRILDKTGPIIGVSGRNVEAFEETDAMISKYDIPIDFLRLRHSTDPSHNGEHKVAIVKDLREHGFTPILMLEDHVAVSEMIEAAGVPTVTVNPRFVDEIGVNFNNLSELKGSHHGSNRPPTASERH